MSQADFKSVMASVCTAQGWALDRNRVELSLESGRDQGVEFENFEFEDEALVRLVSPIGSTEQIEPLHLNNALRLNYGLPYGALALRGEQLVLIDSVMADNVEVEEIEAVVRYLAETADHFERTLFGSDEF